jgi:catalase
VSPLPRTSARVAKLRDALASHTDALAQSNLLATHDPPDSYVTETYCSIHTFKFVDAGGAVRLIKWPFVPHDGVRKRRRDNWGLHETARGKTKMRNSTPKVTHTRHERPEFAQKD